LAQRPSTLHVIAGPNGSRKSTLTESLGLRGAVLDPNRIASEGARTGTPLSAGKSMQRQIAAATRRGGSFGVETTLSGQTAFHWINRCKTADFKIVLYFICLASPSLCVNRVAHRVRYGGHDVPERDIERRYWRAPGNFPKMLALADQDSLFDNSGIHGHRLAAKKRNGILVADEAADWMRYAGLVG
jgi:predicted ABC-type ATPase